MEHDPSTDEQLRKIFTFKKIAVVGFSKDPRKAAHSVPRYLSENGYEITPVNPFHEEILGKKSYQKTSDIPGEIDVVDVFRPSDQVFPVVQDAIKKKPKVIWLQEGIHNPEAESLAKEQGIQVVFNRCMYAEHRRLF